MSFRITPHRQAPIFSKEKDPQLVLTQVINEISSNFKSDEKTRQLFRQAGFVSFWFFLRCIASYNGPFELLNRGLHLDMCNFFQDVLKPGTKAGGFISRGHYKSTIWSKGGPAWKALRDPNSINYLFSATEDFSASFIHTIQRIYDNNDLFAWLYPEYVPLKNSKRWTDKEGVLPNRTRYMTEPTWAGKGVGGNTQGVHGDLFFDDTVGEAQLNSERECNAEMKKTGHWLESNVRTLAKNQKQSFTFYTATRYAPNDAHSFIFEDLKSKVGYWEGLPYKERSDGEWIVYYRMVEEEGKIIFPESITREFLDKLREENPWVYWTQYVNNPFHSGITELSTHNIKKCELIWTGKEYVIEYHDREKKTVYLKDCYVSQACDPAASEKRTSAKTSQTAVGVHVHAPDDKRFLVQLQAGFITPSKLCTWLFTNADRFRGYLRGTFLEAQGAFKLLEPIIKKELQRHNEEEEGRNIALYLRAVSKSGEKIATIRSTLEPLLTRGLLYADTRVWDKINKELQHFPMGSNDILDMWTLAQQKSIRPYKQDEEEDAHDRFKGRRANTAGY